MDNPIAQANNCWDLSDLKIEDDYIEPEATINTGRTAVRIIVYVLS